MSLIFVPVFSTSSIVDFDGLKDSKELVAGKKRERMSHTGGDKVLLDG